MSDVTFRSDMTVELVNDMADDKNVIMAARVSTLGDMSLHSSPDPVKDAGLINYLMRDRHGSPFEHATFTFLVSAPIFVFREFMRHRMASYNEESGRYKELKPVFYAPARDRALRQVGKPGAYTFEKGDEHQYGLVQDAIGMTCHESYRRYQEMLDAGIAREVARMVLPLNIYSSTYVTMNARALMNFLSLRVQDDNSVFPSFPQREIEMVAEKMEDIFAALMPVTHRAFVSNGRVAP